MPHLSPGFDVAHLVQVLQNHDCLNIGGYAPDIMPPVLSQAAKAASPQHPGLHGIVQPLIRGTLRARGATDQRAAREYELRHRLQPAFAEARAVRQALAPNAAYRGWVLKRWNSSYGDKCGFS